MPPNWTGRPSEAPTGIDTVCQFPARRHTILLVDDEDMASTDKAQAMLRQLPTPLIAKPYNLQELAEVVQQVIYPLSAVANQDTARSLLHPLC